ncbi:3'-5' exonuclease [Photorhabdus luminescens]|uniref:3'-5' exonuclease n=1 Tax=Photorhabdus luminescens TaxID=29488 RepID=UPI00224053A3|nr:3'-5' exonuclease [Photorhabdus luminescens]MCW7764465.1 3'-5' exoribonuclease [Photorhabdus luminescens subsp. venezuelensis]
MNNLMIDLETMGTGPDAAIVAIGAVFFNPSTGEICSQFYSPVDLASSLSYGGTVDGNTVKWWLRQSVEARAEIFRCELPDLFSVLHDLSDFTQTDIDIKVWGNGATFDNIILRSAYERCGSPVFWHFWNDRDVRTIVELGHAIGIDPKNDIKFEGTHHNALADAIHQAKYVSAIYQALTR